jgi:hypothetical protein
MYDIITKKLTRGCELHFSKLALRFSFSISLTCQIKTATFFLAADAIISKWEIIEITLQITKPVLDLLNVAAV